jgi:TP901 family phage tail tape measure protein
VSFGSSTSVTFDILARDRASKAFDKVGSSASSSSSKTAKFGAILKKTGVGLGLMAVAATAFTAKAGVGYVNSLNQIQALTDASNKQMDRAADLLESNAGAYAQMGQTTGDAASGVVELTKSGLSLHKSLQAVYGTMTLAKAGALDVADASSITANALNTLHLKAKRAGDVANYLANAANISSADVSDIAESFKYVAPVAASAGVSIKQTNAILAELANSGIKASQAGTSLRTFLLNLQAPTGAAANVMDDLGIKIYDATGKMKPLGDVIGILQDKLKGLNQADRNTALKAIFGKTGIAGALTILDQGTKGLEKYTKGIGRAGAASKLATSRSKGLAGSFDIIRSSAVSGAQTIYRKFSPIADQVIRPLAKKFADFAANLGPNLDKGFKKIGDVAHKIDLSGLGKKLGDQAKAWAGPVIAGFNTGLNDGDWSGLGKALGNGLIKAAGALGDLSGKLGEVLGKIDWVGIGIDVGKQAPSFFVGLAAGLLNFDLMGLLKGMAKHWTDILLAVLAIAFTPGKIVGKVGELLARIPLAGKLLEWGLLAFKRLSDRLVGWAFDALKFMGRSFLTGFRRVFPNVGAKFAEHLALFPLRVQLMGLKLAEKGLKMIRGLGSAIAKGIGFVVSKLGELIARMLKPFVDTNTWLVKKGVELLGGLLRGITSSVGKVLAPLKTLGSKAVSAVGNMGSKLFNAGADLIQGFINGIGSKIGSVKSKLGDLTGKLTSWKGPPEKDRKILTPAGQLLMEGLVDGITKGFVPVKKVLAKVTDYVKAQGQKVKSLLSSRADFAQGFQSFTSSVFSADLSQTSTDAFGNEVTTPSTIGDILAYQAAQRDKARQLKADVARLHQLGLSDALIKQLQASGESGMAQIHTLAGGSRGDIAQLNALNRQTQGALAGAGSIAAGQLYNARIAQARNNEDLAERIARKLAQKLHEAGKDEELVIRDANGDWIIRAVRKTQRQRKQKQTL